MTEGKLVFQPKGYRVVDVDEIINKLSYITIGGCTCLTKSPDIQYHDEHCHYRLLVEAISLLKAAPPIDTPPVLRWEGGHLYVFGARIGSVWKGKHCWGYSALDYSYGGAETEQKAHRTAEKALGFPEWLVVEEV